MTDERGRLRGDHSELLIQFAVLHLSLSFAKMLAQMYHKSD